MANNETMDNIETEAEPTAATIKKYRVQLDFTAEDFQKLNDLTVRLRLTTRVELIRCSLASWRNPIGFGLFGDTGSRWRISWTCLQELVTYGLGTERQANATSFPTIRT